MIKEDYVSFEIAKLLKEKGFNAKCDKCYAYFADDDIRFLSLKYPKLAQLLIENRYPCVTLQMAIKWLREIHHLHIGINPISGKGYNATIYDVADFDDCGIIYDTEFFFHPKEAVDASLKYCLENLI